MRFITDFFTKHPASVGETYFAHMAMAFGFGAKMIASGLACLAHGIFPFLCATTGSQAVTKLYISMVTHRDEHSLDKRGNDEQGTKFANASKQTS